MTITAFFIAMKYENIVKGIFSDRPNRFIGNVLLNGKYEVCHIKNTGRCKELLYDGAEVFLQKSSNPHRKTKYDLISVKKDDRIINIDSHVVNYVVIESLNKLFDNIKYIKPEQKYGNSRFDIYVETEKEKIYIEVKGVTLEKDNIALFPDAPTERGIRHLKELQNAVTEGFKAYIIFVIQMDEIKYFKPNLDTHPEFAHELSNAVNNGVVPIAFNCRVKYDSIELNEKIIVDI